MAKKWKVNVYAEYPVVRMRDPLAGQYENILLTKNRIYHVLACKGRVKLEGEELTLENYEELLSAVEPEVDDDSIESDEKIEQNRNYEKEVSTTEDTTKPETGGGSDTPTVSGGETDTPTVPGGGTDTPTIPGGGSTDPESDKGEEEPLP